MCVPVFVVVRRRRRALSVFVLFICDYICFPSADLSCPRWVRLFVAGHLRARFYLTGPFRAFDCSVPVSLCVLSFCAGVLVRSGLCVSWVGPVGFCRSRLGRQSSPASGWLVLG
jgi:hypothetical protein